MNSMKPQQKALAMWRVFAVAAALPPAFLCSFLLRAGSLPWILGTCAWIGIFLYVYLFYLPRRHESITFRIRAGHVEMTAGVFIRRCSVLPLHNIQFTTVLADPFARVFGLCALRIVAPGGRMFIPGLLRRDAESLSALLTDEDYK